jgi:hypothetical protein
MLSPSSRSHILSQAKLLELLVHPDDGGSILFRTLGKRLPDNTVYNIPEDRVHCLATFV